MMDRLGDAPRRYRGNSGRCLLLFRAAEGEPRKVSISGKLGKIECLGHGQQFVVHGYHPTGVPSEWFPSHRGPYDAMTCRQSLRRRCTPRWPSWHR